MSVSPLAEWVNAPMFVPFVVTMASGREITVLSKEMILLGQQRDIVSFVDHDGFDRHALLFHDHITSVESYAAVQSPGIP